MEHIKKLILPTPEEKERLKKVEKRICDFLNKLNIKHEICGSYARDTFVRGNNEIDIFLMYPEDFPEKKFKDEIIRIGNLMKRKRIIKDYIINYASHPYIQLITEEGVKVDLVPCYDTDKIISAVDRTPKHNRYLKDKLTQEMKEDVVLLKVWLKERNVYGAELKHEGFSGYLCELLIVKYGSFENVIKAMAKEWKPGYKIFFTNNYQGPLDYPLVVEDPVDPKRNVAAPVSLKTLIKTIVHARLYLEEYEDFFLKKEPHLFESSERIALKIKLEKEINEDILWSQIKNLKTKIITILEQLDFELNKISCHYYENFVWYVLDLKSLKINKLKLLKGPKVTNYKDLMKFVTKRGYFFVNDKGEVCSFKYRDFYDVKTVLENIDEFVKIPKYLNGDREVTENIPDHILIEHYTS